MKPTVLSTIVFVSFVAVGLQTAPAQNTTTPSTPEKRAEKKAAIIANDSAEAGMLRNAYTILATGDHDYKGHRVHAMHAVKAAADLLGLDLGGDDKFKQPQPLSDAKLREAQSQIQQVINSAAVSHQKRVVKHLEEAISQINTALSVR